jgi:hypothetical protein
VKAKMPGRDQWGYELPPLDERPREGLQWGGGIYVVQFPDCVKVGRASGFYYRLSQHWRDGGTSYVAYRTSRDHDNRVIEAQVLKAVLSSGARVLRGSEWFAGRTFDQIAWTVERTIYRLTGDIYLCGSVTYPNHERRPPMTIDQARAIAEDPTSTPRALLVLALQAFRAELDKEQSAALERQRLVMLGDGR